jgi:hypothetical protein
VPPQKIVVTTTGEDGRSRVERAVEPAPSGGRVVAWPLDPHAAGGAHAPGEISWLFVTYESTEELDAYVRERYGDDGSGRAGAMHRTPTTDFVLVLEGRVELVLDDETVELGAGDCVVQQGTNHAWRVVQGPVTVAALMVGAARA